MHHLRFRGKGDLHVRFYLDAVASRVGAGVLLDVGEKQAVIAGPLGTVHAGTGGGHKRGVSARKRCLCEQEHKAVLDKVMEMLHGKQDALLLVAASSPFLAEALLQRLFLLCGLQLRKQECMTHTDGFGIEGLDHRLDQLGEPEPLRSVAGCFADLGRNLLDTVARLLQIEQSAEALRLLQRVDISALQVFDQLGLQRFGIGKVDDADRNGLRFVKLGCAKASRPGDDLEALLGQRTNEQRREDTLHPDALGKFLQGAILEMAARVAGRFVEKRERKIAVLVGCGVQHNGPPWAW